ncbi:hypothetical protein MKY95_21175 [Paenibacillus sp. FSL P4-0176]|uniref:hypothetical protein n=1 Tax=Paenibacillus sp. FSL P4-0176 TaxID=2921631 RepID=UPI0030CC4E75
MSKQEEIKQALVAATPGPWKVYRSKLGKHEETLIGTEYDHPQLKAPDSIVGHAFGVGVEYTYIREADADLIAKAPEYIDWLLKQEQSLQEDIMVLKDMVHTRNVENERLRKEIIVKENSKEILTKQITDEVAISAAAIVERDRLKKELEEFKRVMDEPRRNLLFKYHNERNRFEEAHRESRQLHKKLEEIRKSISGLHHHAEQLYQLIILGDLSSSDLDLADQEFDAFRKIIGLVGQKGEGNSEQKA